MRQKPQGGRLASRHARPTRSRAGLPSWLLAATAGILLAGRAPAAFGADDAPGTFPAALSTTISRVVLRDVHGSSTNWMAPTDTFFVDVTVAEASGFRNITSIELAVSIGSTTSMGLHAWEGARFGWSRSSTPAWRVLTSGSDGWRVLPALCQVDTLTNTTSPQVVRVAFSPGPVARFSSSSWDMQAWAGSATAKEKDFGMRERVEWVSFEGQGRFAASTAGANLIPLTDPSTGRLSFRLVANTDVDVRARAGAFTGIVAPAVRFGGGTSDTTLEWICSDLPGTTSGYLDSVTTRLGNTINAFDDTTAKYLHVSLRLGIPAGLQAQDYRSDLVMQTRSDAGVTGSTTQPLLATVLSGGVAAHNAIAEVEPHDVVAGTVGQSMSARLVFAVGGGETGINRVRAALPAGWTSPHVTGVTTWLGLPVSFVDASTPASAMAILNSNNSSGVLRVNFTATAPQRADPGGGSFTVFFDDTATAVPEQSATEGNTDGDGDSGWHVTVGPAAAARLELEPAYWELQLGDTARFVATVRDAYGNPRADVISWTESGGAGTIDPAGLYTAVAAGTSRIIARSGAFADTAFVQVTDPSASVYATTVAVPALHLLPEGALTKVAELIVCNGAALPDTILGLVLADVSQGLMTPKQRERSWAGFEVRDSTGLKLSTGSWDAGFVRFEKVGVALAVGVCRRLGIFAAASRYARDGDSLGLFPAKDGPLTLSSGRAGTYAGGADTVLHVVDGMSAAQVSLEAYASGPLFAGAHRRPVAELHVPANGYAGDQLLRLNLINVGTAEAGTDLERLEAWLDDGDHALDTLLDARLGTLIFTGDRWEITGLAMAVSDTGSSVLVSANVSAGAREGRTIRFALPTLPDVGLGMASGNSGPIDAEVAARREYVIGGGERVLVTATAVTGGTTRAGAGSVPLLRLALANGYTAARHLSSLVVTNASAGAGSAAQLDATFARVELALEPAGTPPAQEELTASKTPIAVGSFVNGRVTFDGLALALNPAGEVRLVVSADLDAAAVTDGDRLAAHLASPQDLQFDEASTIGGSWPASSGAVWTVNGFDSRQAKLVQVPGLTLAPAEGPLLALDVTVPSNGYLPDVLHGIRIENRGDADAAEIDELRLFRDGGDGRFGGSPADDIDLGALVPVGQQWQSAYVSETVPVGGARFFVGLTVAATTSDSSLVRLAIPVGGVEMESDNDGPLDDAIANDAPHVLSTRPLLASLALLPGSSTQGQQVTLRMLVRNVGAEILESVAPGTLVPEGSASFTVVSGPTPGPATVAPDDSVAFDWTLASTSPGDLRFAAAAVGTGQVTLLERISLAARSGRHVVYMESDSLRLVALQSMPSAVNLGQQGVVPLTLTLEHPGDASSSAIRFDRLRVRLEQEDGSPVVPSQLASAVEVSEGTTVYLRRTSLETSGDELDLALATPVVLSPGEPVSVAIKLDIASSSSVSSFRLVVDDSSGFDARDAISDRPVRVRLQGQAYPIRSGLARLLAGGGALVIGATSPGSRHASAGQAHVALASWSLTHSSALPTSADLRLNAILLRASAGAPLAPPLPWSRWRVTANGITVGTHEAAPTDTGDVRIDLVPSPIIQPGAAIALRIEADLSASGAGARFVVDGVRSSQWEVRDVNSGEPAPVNAAVTLPGDTLTVDHPASVLDVAPSALMPSTVAAGRSRLPALDLVLRHPGPAGTASVRVDSVRVALCAPDGRALQMDDYLSALRLTHRGATLGSLVAPAASEAVFAPPFAIACSDLDTLRIELDVAGDATSGSIEVRVTDGAVRACDDNTGVPVTVSPEPPATWPLSSGPAAIVAPARELRVTAHSELPAMLAPGGGTVGVAAMVLRHPGPAGSGPIAVDHVVARASDEHGAGLPVGRVAASIQVHQGALLLGTSGPLAADATIASLAFGLPLEIAAGDSVVLAWSLTPRAADPSSRFRIGWEPDDIGVVQPASAALAVAVLAGPGASFPMWTEAAGFTANGLRESYANFPNPFAAGRDATTFAFLMPAPGRVTLRIWTARGEAVTTLLDGAVLAAGLRQSDRWDGRNGRGDVVANGVYVAELDVRLDDGRHERVLRKVAVVR